MKVQILQGVSGAGKSTYTQRTIDKYGASNVECFSADNFFMVDNQYKFDRTKLSEAHAQCLRKYTMWLIHGAEDPNGSSNMLVIVDNTNTSVAEIAPYYQLAIAWGHEVEIIIFITDPQIAAHRNIHSVPEKTVISQWNRINESWRNFPRYWKHQKI